MSALQRLEQQLTVRNAISTSEIGHGRNEELVKCIGTGEILFVIAAPLQRLKRAAVMTAMPNNAHPVAFMPCHHNAAYFWIFFKISEHRMNRLKSPIFCSRRGIK